MITIGVTIGGFYNFLAAVAKTWRLLTFIMREIVFEETVLPYGGVVAWKRESSKTCKNTFERLDPQITT